MNINKDIKIRKIKPKPVFLVDKVIAEAGDIIARRNDYYDRDGIVLYVNRDGQEHYNPLLIARYALRLLVAWKETLNMDYKKALDNYIYHLLYDPKIVELDKLYPYYPYRFDFHLHNNPDWTMKAPWYSALAQGRILSLLCEVEKAIREFSDEPPPVPGSNENQVKFDCRGKAGQHHPAIEKLFTGLALEQSILSKTDDKGFWWLDEYPHPYIFDMTLNGHITALAGIYDYWCLTNSRKAKQYLQAGITTVFHYANRFRNPGGPSYYCLAHKVLCDKADFKYHRIHIDQFDWLFDITGYPFFKAFAEKLRKDVKLN